jgi:Rieske Fe-S protein
MSSKPGSPSNRSLWSEEFSVHGAEDAYVLRRQFTKFLLLTSGGMAVGNAWIWARSLVARSGSAPPVAVVGRASELLPGAVKLFAYPTPQDPAILLRTPDGAVSAFSQTCTHLSCAVYYSAEDNRLECPCHEGYFSARTGRVLQGPPPRPLPRIRIEQRGDDLVATGIEVAEADE